MILLYTKAEVENVLIRMSMVMRGRVVRSYNNLLLDLKDSGFSFTRVTWDEIQGSYFGQHFYFRSRENIVTGNLDSGVKWYLK